LSRRNLACKPAIVEDGGTLPGNYSEVIIESAIRHGLSGELV